MQPSGGSVVAGWRAWVPGVVLAFVASRVVLLFVVAVVEASGALAWSRTSYVPDGLLAGLTGHDAIYYLGIAAQGYHLGPVNGPYQDWVFFPAYPALVRMVSVLTNGDIAVAGLLAANAVALLALLVVGYAVAEREGPEIAVIAAALVAFAPGAVAFGLAYSDSILLAASAGLYLAVRRERWLVAGLLYAVATLARPPGILFGIPLVIGLLGQPGASRWRWATVIAGPIALLAFAAGQGYALGDPLAFIHGQAAWNVAAAAGFGAAAGAGAGGSASIAPWVALLIVTLCAYTALIPGLLRSGIPRMAVATALVAFATVFVAGRLQSDARYIAVGWPFAWFLATRGSTARTLAIAISAAGFTLFAMLHVTQLLAP